MEGSSLSRETTFEYTNCYRSCFEAIRNFTFLLNRGINIEKISAKHILNNIKF